MGEGPGTATLQDNKALFLTLGAIEIEEFVRQMPHPKYMQLAKEGFAVAKQRQGMFSSVTQDVDLSAGM